VLRDKGENINLSNIINVIKMENKQNKKMVKIELKVKREREKINKL